MSGWGFGGFAFEIRGSAVQGIGVSRSGFRGFYDSGFGVSGSGFGGLRCLVQGGLRVSR